ncbi:MAG: cell division protein FtsZ [Prevotellaceae bacterium]|jgi:cell division protein FtsZ|nr:cell division protein FtsZ [Prevotellaceae bacterium]
MENYDGNMEWVGKDDSQSIIKVMGVGGGGGNAVNYMYKLGIYGAGFMVCNTDGQALDGSSVPTKILLGTSGLGAGSDPAQGKKAAEESIDQIESWLKSSGTKMVFITVGMGGGTGTGATPVIAEVAKRMGILTIAVATMPFTTIEAEERFETACKGIETLHPHVDALMLVNNEQILTLYGDLEWDTAFAKANEVLCTAVKSMIEIITVPSEMNMDFADVGKAMRGQGVAFIGMGKGSGTDRAIQVVEEAIASPLLNNNSIYGAKNVLINIMNSPTKKLRASEIRTINTRIFEKVGKPKFSKTGIGTNSQLVDDEVTVSLVATGFDITDINQMVNGGRPAPPPDNDPPPSPPSQDDDVETVLVVVDSDANSSPPYEVRHDASTTKTGAAASRPKKAVVPRWLNREFSFDVLEKPIVSQNKLAHKEEEKSSNVLNRTTQGWQPSGVAYIKNNPD